VQTSTPAVVRFFADDWNYAVTPPAVSTDVVAYYLVTTGSASALHRMKCLAGSGTPAVDATIAGDIVPGSLTVTCSSTCAATPPPSSVSMTFSVARPTVLQLVAEGRTAEQIGRRLSISTDTARTHVSHILRKLDARDRAHAVAIAFQAALLPARRPIPPSDVPAPARLAAARHLTVTTMPSDDPRPGRAGIPGERAFG
jgi:DNA-binding NarL/FixJ family response regulator